MDAFLLSTAISNIYILRARIFFKRNFLTIWPYCGIETRRFMRAIQVFSLFVLQHSLAHGKDTTKYEFINTWLKSPTIRNTQSFVHGLSPGEREKTVTLGDSDCEDSRDSQELQSGKKLIQDGKIYIAKYFPANNMPVFCFSHCNFNSLENTL